MMLLPLLILGVSSSHVEDFFKTPMEAEMLLQASGRARSGLEKQISNDIAPCVPEAIELNFATAKIIHHNLAGQGPKNGPVKKNPALLHYEGIGTYLEQSLDLQVEVLNPDTYIARRPKRSGFQGLSGQVNLRLGSEAQLRFTFLWTKSQVAVALPAFWFSIYDIDGQTEAWEQYTVSGFDDIFIPSDKEYDVTDNSDGSKTMRSNMDGTLCDNPKEPLVFETVKCRRPNRVVDQRKRAFAMLFRDRSSFDMKFEIVLKPGVPDQHSGRNMEFAGMSGLVEECPIPTPPPMAPCVSDAVQLDFHGATIIQNNLAGQGPDTTGPEYMRFAEIGEFEGQKFDLKVEALNPDTYIAIKPYLSGLLTYSGQVNMRIDNSVDLQFSFVKTGTEEHITLPHFYFSLFDLDQGKIEQERYTVYGFEEFYSPSDREYEVSDNLDGSKTCTSQKPGSRCDNVENPQELTVIKCKKEVKQWTRALTMLYGDTSTFHVKFEIPMQPGKENPTKYHGRNLNFGGLSSLIGQCEHW